MSAPVLPAQPEWGAQTLQQALGLWLPGLSLEVLASTDSTNTRLLERARAGEARPVLLVAEQQTSGRGRLGRAWRSEPGASLTFSLLLELTRADWSGLSLAVGAEIADALEPPEPPNARPPRITLKWPNDLWLRDGPGRGRKLGGVLIESVAPAGRRMAVVGVGLNVAPLSGVANAEGLSHGLACLREIDPEAAAPGALARVAPALVQALQRFDAEGFAPFAAGFARRDLLVGLEVSTSAPEAPRGVAEGVDAQGALRVRAGAVHHVVSGEVSVRWPPPAESP